MSRDEQEVVAEVSEVRHAAVLAGGVGDRRRDIDERHVRPCEADSQDRIEIKSACVVDRLHDAERRLDWIKAESEKRVLGSGAEGFQCGEEISDQASLDPLQWRIGAEFWDSADTGVGVCLRDFHETPDHSSGMLPVGIHQKDMGKSL